MMVNLTIGGIDFRKQTARRRIVVATYGSFALALLGICLKVPGISAVAGLVVAFGWWVLNQVAVQYADASCGTHPSPLDERQSLVRNRAFFRSYQIVCSVVALFLCYAVVAGTVPKFGLWMPTTLGDYETILFGFLTISVTLPHAFIAWQDPDYPEDDLPA